MDCALQRVLLGADFAAPIVFITGHAGEGRARSGLKIRSGPFCQAFQRRGVAPAALVGMGPKVSTASRRWTV